jgi:hypothetical protein
VYVVRGMYGVCGKEGVEGTVVPLVCVPPLLVCKVAAQRRRSLQTRQCVGGSCGTGVRERLKRVSRSPSCTNPQEKMFPGTFGTVGCAAILCAIFFVGLRALFQHAHGKVFFGATICLIGFIEIVLQTDTFKLLRGTGVRERLKRVSRSPSCTNPQEKMFPGTFGKFGCAAILCAIFFVGLRALFQHAHGKVFFGATICLIGFIEIVLETDTFKQYIFKHALDLFRSLSDGGSDAARVVQSTEAQCHNKHAQQINSHGQDYFRRKEESSEAAANIINSKLMRMVARFKAGFESAQVIRRIKEQQRRKEAEDSEAAAKSIQIDFPGNDWKSKSEEKHSGLKHALDLFLSDREYGEFKAVRVSQLIKDHVLELAKQGGKAYEDGLADYGKNMFHSAISKLERFHDFSRFVCDKLREPWPASVKVDIQQSQRFLQLAV